MATKPPKDPSKYGNYAQYAFRASRDDIDALQKDVDTLYAKFNKGRDTRAPRGRKAVKVGDIALEAIKIGIKVLQKRNKWHFKD